MEDNKKEIKSVSVVMATYNGEKYLQEQIESILNQSNVNVSLLVRDDGSTDKTTFILDNYQTKGLLKWYTGEHLGVQKGYLDLLKHAPVADFYAFSDQDDVWDKEKLYTAVSYLCELPSEKPAVYYCGQKLVDEKLHFLSEHKIATNRSPHTNYLISNVAGCTAVFNQKLTNLINSKNPSFILMHDSWLFKVCLAMGGSYYADTHSYINYRQHEGNVVGLSPGLKGKIQRVKMYIEELKIQKQMQSLLECYGEEMTPEYKQLTQKLCEYDKSLWSRFLLIVKRDYDFKSLSLNIIVTIKIIFKKL